MHRPGTLLAKENKDGSLVHSCHKCAATGDVMTTDWQMDADARNSNIFYCGLKSLIGYCQYS